MPSLRPLRMAALLGGLFVGCHCTSVRPQIIAPGLVDTDLRSATRIMPTPAVYYSWWRKTEACSGIRKPMRATFYAVPKFSFKADTTSLVYLGLYLADSNLATGHIRERIYLAAPWAYTEWLVRHEMLHSLLRGKHHSVTGHPPEFFVTKCALMNFQNSGRPTPPPFTTPVPLPAIPQQTLPHLPVSP